MTERATTTPDPSRTAAAASAVPEEEHDESVVHFTLDGRPAQTRKGEMLITAAERAGTFIPRFCYHPRMKAVGVCRMCLVEVSGPRGASLQPSCFIEVPEGADVVTDSPKVKKARDGILEFLLVNHPLDCPVCDKGGECPLQDQTMAYGPGETRFVEEKRHFEKPIAISELVLLDRERCIQCSRCTRFAAEVAGEAQIDFIGRGERLEVNTFPDLPFASYFSGNTVQICPVGALTAVPYRFTARPWDLDQVESTCTTCALGCRIVVQSSANRVTRLLGIDAEPVNHGWLCDKGRFVFDSVNGDARLTEPMVRKDGVLVPVSWHEALAATADGLRRPDKPGRSAGDSESGSPSPTDAGLAGIDGRTVGVIGGARLTNEGAYAWTRVAKAVLGTDSVDAQLGDGLPAEVVLGLPRATIDEAVASDTVVLLTGDVREELPVLFLRLRSAVIDGGLSVVELSAHATSLTPYAAVSLRYRPGDAASLVRVVTGDGHEGLAPDGALSELDTDEVSLARRLVSAEKVVVVVGRPSLAEDCALVSDAAQALAVALPHARFLPAMRRGNVMGALDMGMAPGLLPGRVTLEGGRARYSKAWGSVPAGRGLDTTGMLVSLAATEGHGGDGATSIRSLVVLGADPLTDFPDSRLARRALDAASFVVAVASAPGPIIDAADVVLPAAEAHERPGTTTNVEGRVSRLGQKVVPPGEAWPDWMIASELAAHLGADLHFDSIAEVWDEIERLSPAHHGMTMAVLDAPYAADGLPVPLAATPVSIARRSMTPLDPIAFPGVESVERQGAPPRAGFVEAPTAGPGETDSTDESGGAPSGRSGGAGADTGAEHMAPLMLTGPIELEVPHVVPTDSYSMRLVSGRRLYDSGTAVSSSPALAGLIADAPVRVNPHDLDDLGVASGGRVRARAATASLVLEVLADPLLPRRVVAIDFNVPLTEGTVADLIDVTVPVTELRLETP